jgi:uncharacterized coiled-coil DUF342 family protein
MTTAATKAKEYADSLYNQLKEQREGLMELRNDYNTLKEDRDCLLIKNHDLTRKFDHEVARLNTIIGNYREEILRLSVTPK